MLSDCEIIVGSKDYPITAAITYTEYPDGAPLVHFNEFWNAVEILQGGPESWSLLLRPRTMSAFLAGMFFVDALSDRGYPPPDLVLPLMPGSRQDRKNIEGDFLFTAKSVANMINARGFERVILVDPHSDVTPALIDRSISYTTDDVYSVLHSGPTQLYRDSTWWVSKDDYVGVIAPDAGASKRAYGVARHLGVPVLQAWKKRSLDDGKIVAIGIEPLESEKYLVVDDLCDGGATFIELAKQLDDYGARADLYVTHGLFTKGYVNLLMHYDRIITTDSVARPDDGGALQIIPICERLILGGSIEYSDAN